MVLLWRCMVLSCTCTRLANRASCNHAKPPQADTGSGEKLGEVSQQATRQPLTGLPDMNLQPA
jgi:hypothetical protein